MHLSLVSMGLCLYGLAGIIRCQFIIQNSDIFFIFVTNDGSFQFPLIKAKIPPRRNAPRLGNTVIVASSCVIVQKYIL